MKDTFIIDTAKLKCNLSLNYVASTEAPILITTEEMVMEKKENKEEKKESEEEGGNKEKEKEEHGGGGDHGKGKAGMHSQLVGAGEKVLHHAFIILLRNFFFLRKG